MRIRINFSGVYLVEIDKMMTKRRQASFFPLLRKEIWISDFPCRVHDGDIFGFEVLGNEWCHFYDVLDPPVVISHSFGKDEHGIYQAVHLGFPKVS